MRWLGDAGLKRTVLVFIWYCGRVQMSPKFSAGVVPTTLPVTIFFFKRFLPFFWRL